MPQGVAIAVGGAPDADLAQLVTRIEVEERVGQATTFRIHCPVQISDGDFPLLTDSRFDPGTLLSILVPAGETTHCLVNGPVQGEAIHLEHGEGSSTLEVRGSDQRIAMDRETKVISWDGLTDSDAATAVLAGYGFIPAVDNTPARHDETGHTLVQRESDLHFVRRLAARNGFLFWLTSDAFSVVTAHFGRPSLQGEGDPELVINLDSPNLNTLDIEWDVERPTSVDAAQLDLRSKSDIDGAVSTTPNTVLGSEGLQDITGDTRSVHIAAPVDDGGDLQARGEGALAAADWFIRATARTTLNSVGSLIRSHTLVKIRGAGSRHSGNYFVTGVRHLIDDSAHTMELELARNGWGA